MKVIRPHKAQISIAFFGGGVLFVFLGGGALTAFTDLLYLVRSVNRPFNGSERNSRSIIIPNRPPSSSNSAAKLLLQLQLAAAAQRPSNRFQLWQNGLIPMHRYYSMFSWFTASSEKTMSAAPFFTAVPVFT